MLQSNQGIEVLAQEDDNDDDYGGGTFTTQLRSCQQPPSGSSSLAVHGKMIVQFLLLWQFVAKITDTALVMILKFLKLLIAYLGTAFCCPSLAVLANDIPSSLYKAKQILGISTKSMCRYIVCPKCNCVYKGDEFPLTVRELGNETSARCPYIAFPLHPQVR